jgi:hypothetical protein
MAAGTALRKINAEVKRLKKKHPGTRHVTLQKQAGKAYRAGKLGGVKKKSVHHKKVHHKKSHHKKVGASREVGKDRLDNKRVNITVGSITTAQAKNLVRANTKEQMAWALLQRDTATTKTAKKKINKKIVSLRKQLHSYS